VDRTEVGSERQGWWWGRGVGSLIVNGYFKGKNQYKSNAVVRCRVEATLSVEDR
jgi:hypothetical protein